MPTAVINSLKMATQKQPPRFKFFVNPHEALGYRLGSVVLGEIEIVTPGLLVNASRGVVPHLSRDHTTYTESIRWVNIPFETLYVSCPTTTFRTQLFAANS
jgi:hypothetical protein